MKFKVPDNLWNEALDWAIHDTNIIVADPTTRAYRMNDQFRVVVPYYDYGALKCFFYTNDSSKKTGCYTNMKLEHDAKWPNATRVRCKNDITLYLPKHITDLNRRFRVTLDGGLVVMPVDSTAVERYICL